MLAAQDADHSTLHNGQQRYCLHTVMLLYTPQQQDGTAAA
jgi:hypothetical protein